ncbi:hypothetical protein J2S82_003397 [Aeromonas caviae]|uniref:hypothetical protein n=1 Tax=Aeromonas caviae TaxID=648 RepID=UPI0020A0F813|nr:hypothetical protein [Aeromonas caviae]MCP1601440.1 hypothetical protein [Aeromonas caviae]
MKKSIILLCAALLGGCIQPAQGDEKTPQEVRHLKRDFRIFVWHDDQRRVTCWVYIGNQEGGISCLPDGQLSGGK